MTEVRIASKANGDIPAVNICEDVDAKFRWVNAQVFEPGRSLIITSNCAGVAASMKITFDEARALAMWLSETCR